MVQQKNYTWLVNDSENRVEITDLSNFRGGMTVTNAAESVLTELREEIGDKIEGLKIIYCDTNGEWDTLLPKWSADNCASVNFKSGI